MDDLLKTRFFSLLSEPSQTVTNEEMQNAYGQFIKQVETVSGSEDKPLIFRTLNFTRIEMAHLQTIFRYEMGEKCPEKCIL